MRLENGKEIDMQSQISDSLVDEMHVWVVLKGKPKETQPIWGFCGDRRLRKH